MDGIGLDGSRLEPIGREWDRNQMRPSGCHLWETGGTKNGRERGGDGMGRSGCHLWETGGTKNGGQWA